MDKKNCKSVEEYINNFLVSCVAYCVTTFVLGIGDTHNNKEKWRKIARALGYIKNF